MKKSHIATLLIFGLRLTGRAYYLTSTLVIIEIIIPFLLAFESRKPQARELVLRWQAHLVKFSRSCDEEKLRRLADLYSWDNRFAEVLDSYGPGTAHFMGEAIEAYLETL